MEMTATMYTIRRIASLAVFAAALLPAWTSAGEWPGFRGDGTATVPSLPAELPSTRPAWTVKVNGKCSAGLAVAEGALVLADHAEGKYDAYRCLDAATGAERWVRRFDNNREMAYGAAPRATPRIYHGKVYVLSAFGELDCLDLKTGQTIWEKKYADVYGAKTPPTWGFCASPLIAGGRLIVHPGGTGGLVALNPDNGQQIWSCTKTEPNYSSFIVGTFGGVMQVVGFDSASLGGWDLATGKRLWEVPVRGDNGYIVPTPVRVGDKLFVANNAAGAMLFAFGKGGVIDKEPVATSDVPAPEVCTPVVSGDMILSAADGLTALHTKDLKLLYTDEDEPAPAAECHLLVAGHRALAIAPSGQAVFFTFDAKGIKVTSKIKLCGATQAHPAIANNMLYVRDSKNVYAFRLRRE